MELYEYGALGLALFKLLGRSGRLGTPSDAVVVEGPLAVAVCAGTASVEAVPIPLLLTSHGLGLAAVDISV